MEEAVGFIETLLVAQGYNIRLPVHEMEETRV